MKNFLTVTILFVSVGSAFAQGRGPSRGGAPTNIGSAHIPSTGAPNTGAANSNKPSSIPPADSGKGASALETGGFKNHGQYIAAQHVSENLGISLDELRAKMTGDNAVSLGKAIQDLKGLPPEEANAAAKKAEDAAKKAENATKKQGKR